MRCTKLTPEQQADIVRQRIVRIEAERWQTTTLAQPEEAEVQA